MPSLLKNCNTEYNTEKMEGFLEYNEITKTLKDSDQVPNVCLYY